MKTAIATPIKTPPRPAEDVEWATPTVDAAIDRSPPPPRIKEKLDAQRLAIVGEAAALWRILGPLYVYWFLRTARFTSPLVSPTSSSRK